MEILCQHCIPHKYIPIEHYSEHLALTHLPSQEEINSSIKAHMETIEQQVEYVLRKVKPAQSNSGLCIQLTMRYFPMKETNYRIIYDAATGEIGIEGKDEYMKLAKFMKRIGSISRADRRIREKYPELDGSPRSKVKRETQEIAYRNYYGGGFND